MKFLWNWEEMKPQGFRGVRVGRRREGGRLRATTEVPAVETPAVASQRAGRGWTSRSRAERGTRSP